jgi:hypothetical protein
MKKELPYWAETVRLGSVSIYAFERLDRGSAIFIKYSDPGRTGRDRRVKVRLPGSPTVRDSKGRISPRLVRQVISAIEEYAKPLFAGERLLKANPKGDLTLSEGFELVLDLESGKYASETRNYAEVKKASVRLVRYFGRATTWTSISPSDIRRFWRLMATQSAAHSDGIRSGGVRQTESTLSVLYASAAWLREEGHLPQG